MASRPRALLIHSGGLSSRQWRRLAETLAPTHAVLAPDLLGYGTAGAWAAGAPFHFRQDVERLAGMLLADDGTVDVVGHSYGGLLALKLALAHPPAVRSLSLYEPVAFGILDARADADALAELERVAHRYVPDADGADDAWLEHFVDWWNGAGTWAGLPAAMRAGFHAVSWKLYQEVTSLRADRTDAATFGTIAAPTLLLGGALTPLPARRVLQRLASALPHATLHELPGVGHMGPVSHPALVNDAIVAHVRAAWDR